MSAVVEIEKLAAWSAGKEVSTQRGPRILRKAAPTDAFSAAWKASKATPEHPLRAAGVGWSKDDRTGNWEAVWWQPVGAATVAAEEKAVEASRQAEAPDGFDVPAPAGLDYLPYQKAGIATMAGRSANLLADEMGLGKTVQAIGLVNADPTVKKVLVACPASLKLNWQRELNRWLVRPAKVAVQQAGEPWVGQVADVVVINYDIVDRYSSQIAGESWDLFVADEAHYLKNPKAQRTAAVLGKKPKRDGTGGVKGVAARKRVFMSGTPVENRPVELFPILEALQPGRWGFKRMVRYCDGKQTKWGWDFTGAAHMDEFQRELRKDLMVRRLKKDVLTELPAKRRQIVELPSDGLEDVLRAEAESEAVSEGTLAELRARVAAAELADDEAKYAELSAQLAKAQMVAFDEMSEARRRVAMAKLPMVVEHVKSVLDQNGKVVVFAHHRDAVDALCAAFADAGAVKLYGGMKDSGKDAAVQAFQGDPACRVFVGGIKAAGVGLTLTASSHVVFAELDWVPGVVTQAEDRCHRIGQTESVLVQHLVLEGSLDARMVKFIVRKQEVIDRALDKGALKLEGAAPVLQVSIGSVLEDRKGRTAPQKGAAAPAEGPEAKPVSEELREMAHAGLKRLAGSDWDRAREVNGVGFNKLDGAFGHALAERDRLTDKMVPYAVKLCVKYRRQLGADFADRLEELAS